MNIGEEPAEDMGDITPEEMTGALFTHMVVQQFNMAMMFLGKVAHPETGQTVKDLDAARMFIDMLEMIEVKTRGNLTNQEAELLRESLTNARLTFVDAMESGAANKPPEPKAEPSQKSSSNPVAPEATKPTEDKPSPVAPPAPSEEEQKKKFSKKY